MYGVRSPIEPQNRPDRSPPAHSRHKELLTALAGRNYGGTCLGIQIGYLTSRSLNWQRQAKTRERASDGQPENLVGRLCYFYTYLNRPKQTLTLALSQRERGLTEVFGGSTPT